MDWRTIVAVGVSVIIIIAGMLIQNIFFAPKKAVETICAKLTHARLTHWHFTPLGLGLERLGHLDWVKNSRPLVERITPWLREAVGRAREAGAS